jgi:lipopolysaccharide transport system ATP-binding protein
MHVRLAFAVATQLKPEILLIDEVLAVGDARFQRKCLQRIQEVGRGARTIIFVSHNMAAVRAICKTGVLLEHGQIVSQGEINNVVDAYLARTQNADATQNLDLETTSYKVDRVTIAPGDGLVIKTFEPIEIRVQVTAKVDLDAPGLIAKLMTSNHEPITGLDFANFGSIAPLAKGEQRELGFHVESLPLLPGMYVIELELKNRRNREGVSEFFPFEVVETPVYDVPRGKLGASNGCVVLKAHALGGRVD